MWVATGAGLTGLLFPSDLFPTGFPPLILACCSPTVWLLPSSLGELRCRADVVAR